MGSESAALGLSAPAPGVYEAVILEAPPGEPARVRPVVSALEQRVSARVAVQGYVATVGDRVLVAPGAHSAEGYVVGVLHASCPATLRAPDGGSAALDDAGRIVVRDARGEIVVRYDARAGEAHITAPGGDLVLAAPAGRVVLSARDDIEVRSTQGVISQRGARGVELEARTGDTPGARFALEPERATLAAPSIDAAGESVAIRAGRLELHARRLIERTREAYREAEELLQTRAGRVRTVVRGALQVVARRTHLASREETTIDGEKILLG